MSRFANREATERLVLGPCGCPGTPHTEDWVDLRKELSATDWGVIFSGNNARAISVLIAGWNLRDDHGDVAPSETAVDALDLATFTSIDNWIEKNLEVPKLPNPSAAPSSNGSKEAASRTRKTRTNGSSTTPSWQPAGRSGTSSTPVLSS